MTQRISTILQEPQRPSQGEPTGPLARLERELARRASFPFSAAIAPGFIPAGMFVLEEDGEIADEWQNPGEQGEEPDDEQEQDDSISTPLVANPLIHIVTGQRNAMSVIRPPDESDPDRPARRLPIVDSGDWLTIREHPGKRQDGDDSGQRPALDPRFPLPNMPNGGAAILLSIAQKQAQAQQRGALLADNQGSGQDWHPFDYVVFEDPGEEFVYPVIPVWEEEEEQVHTEANGYTCGDPTCVCATQNQGGR